jgi:hypothetical protein
MYDSGAVTYGDVHYLSMLATALGILLPVHPVGFSGAAKRHS